MSDKIQTTVARCAAAAAAILLSAGASAHTVGCSSDGALIMDSIVYECAAPALALPYCSGPFGRDVPVGWRLPCTQQAINQLLAARNELPGPDTMLGIAK